MGLLRTLGDTRFRSYATPTLISWIYRGCLTAIVLATAFWALVAWWVMSWRSGWFWGAALLVCAPLVGILAALCVRVALEFAVVRFPSPVETSGDHDTAASGTHPAAPLVSRAVDTARSVIHSLRTQPQGGRPVHPDEPASTDPVDNVLPDLSGGERPGDVGGDGDGPHGPPAMRSIWLAAGVGGVVLVLALALALIVGDSGGGKKHQAAPSAAASAPSAPVTVTVTAPATPAPSASSPASPSAPVPSGSAPAGPGATTPTWTGTVTMVGPSSDRDLDSVPPRAVEGGSTGDIRGDWLEPVLHSTGSGQVAQLPAGAPSGPAQCAAAIASSSSNRTETLRPGDVVCVDTGAGHVARLVVVRATQSSTSPTLEFKATVWPAPQGAGQ